MNNEEILQIVILFILLHLSFRFTELPHRGRDRHPALGANLNFLDIFTREKFIKFIFVEIYFDLKFQQLLIF